MTVPSANAGISTTELADVQEKLRRLITGVTPTFLLGAGCSVGAGLPLTAQLTDSVLADCNLSEESSSILTSVQAEFGNEAATTNAHIEDHLSELVDLHAIAKRREERNATTATVQVGSGSYTAGQLRKAIEEIKRAIVAIIGSDVAEAKLQTHRDFIAAVHRQIRQGRQNAGIPVNYLVLNYDTLLEDALALQKVSYTDGLDGGPTGWWNLDTFERDDLQARVFKLHGSVNWCELERDPLPRRLNPRVLWDDANPQPILVWPASTKYRETQHDPFAQLSQRAWREVTATSDQQQVLVICGYSFSDAHVNDEITRSLQESSGQLTVAVFTSERSPEDHDQLDAWHRNEDLKENVLIYAKGGFFHGAENRRSAAECSWWKFDELVRIIEGT